MVDVCYMPGRFLYPCDAAITWLDVLRVYAHSYMPSPIRSFDIEQFYLLPVRELPRQGKRRSQCQPSV